MAHSLSKVIIHIVFATKYRRKTIAHSRQKGLHAYIAGVCRHHSAEAYRVGGVEDHVHIACRLPRTISVSKLVEEVKKGSSKWMKTGEDNAPAFQWQRGYGVFSISQSHLPALLRYIDNQAAHHHRHSLEKEIRTICERYDVDSEELLSGE